ncbi:hypothetical protein [Streptomyces sp. NPDC007206]|uniref:hypothetical protein n=1 Tax=Streptomyces sp. NPDC007206 TaxID=3154317 RepID=UPI0033D9A7B7
MRAYTAAVHSGREQEARQILDAFPVPTRSLQSSGPATAWRHSSATAQGGLPEELAAVAAAQMQRRLIEAFGSTDRARQVLEGQISYQLQQPPGTHRRATTQAENDLLMRVRDALQEVPGAGTPLDAQDIRARAEHFRARLEYAMARQATLRPAGPDGTDRAVPTTHEQAQTQALAAGNTTPGVQR